MLVRDDWSKNGNGLLDTHEKYNGIPRMLVITFVVLVLDAHPLHTLLTFC